jgi:hypothetical protein
MSHRIDLFCEDLRQKLTIIESGLQGLKAKVEADEVHAERDVRNHLDRVRIPGDTGMERSRNVFSRAVCTLHVLAAGQCLDSATAQAAADLIRQSGLAHKADRPNESHRANVREPHTDL